MCRTSPPVAGPAHPAPSSPSIGYLRDSGYRKAVRLCAEPSHLWGAFALPTQDLLRNGGLNTKPLVASFLFMSRSCGRRFCGFGSKDRQRCRDRSGSERTKRPAPQRCCTRLGADLRVVNTKLARGVGGCGVVCGGVFFPRCCWKGIGAAGMWWKRYRCDRGSTRLFQTLGIGTGSVAASACPPS